MQKSRSFILPMYNLGPVEKFIVNTYMGNSEFEGNEDWGNFFYIELPADMPALLQNRVRSSSSYYAEYDTEDGNIMMVLKINDHAKKEIVEPFLKGKYSEISREYVKTYFPSYINGEISFNYRILTKDKYTPARYIPIRDYWEKQIGVALPPNAEVWSVPLKEDEIYLHLNIS